jgi:hypothetical protein
MICGKCGQFNESGLNFCRYCGSALTQTQTKTQTPPRPHSWASPSSPLHDVAGFSEPQQVQPLVQTPSPTPQPQASGYHCPRCGTTAPPQINRKISTGGWIVFAAMLLFCFPLFWIGFLIKEEERVCSMCFTRIG